LGATRESWGPLVNRAFFDGDIMRNFNENTITDAVLERIKGSGDPRVRQVLENESKHHERHAERQ